MSEVSRDLAIARIRALADKYTSREAAGEKLGCRGTFLSDVLHGRRVPTDRMLKAVGLRKKLERRWRFIERDREHDNLTSAERENLLRGALQAILDRTLQPGESQTARYERIADEFFIETGIMAPGKDPPMEMRRDDEEAQAKWEAFLARPFNQARAVLAMVEPKTHDEEE